jgi:hypothetical protein
MGFVPATARAALAGMAVLAVLATAAPAASGQPLPLGTVTATTDTDSTCPAETTCQGIDVSCPSVSQPARAFVATAEPTAPARGLVVLASGGPGNLWWSEVTSLGHPFMDSLRADGFVVVQLRWVDPWPQSAPGEDAGPGHLACRPATVFKSVYDNQYVPLGLSPGVGACGFCISGNSAGASQVAYAVSFYGLASIVDAVIPTSGPVHSAIAKGCLQNPAESPYWYDVAYQSTIDSSYGFAPNTGPCVMHDPTFQQRWTDESTDTGANDLFYPRTRVAIIVGGQDTSYAPAHARDFAVALESAGSPYVTFLTVPSMPHRIQSSADGLSALHDALLASAGGYPRPLGASPLHVALVPAFAACSVPNDVHGSPLATPSCNPPAQASQDLTIGTRDANGKPATSVGWVRLTVSGCSACATPIPADVQINAAISDVRNRSDLSDYAGQLTGRLSLRLTDQLNGTDPSSATDAATVQDFPFEFAVPCTQTLGDSGAACAVVTSADAIEPGLVQVGGRAIWQLGQVTLLDPDRGVFAAQGLFAP